MQFMTRSAIFVVLLTVLSTAWSTLALPVLGSRDVFDPPITFPEAGDIFTAGQTITVTWNTSSLPAGLENIGKLVLGRLNEEGENLDIDNPLAEGFLLTDGYHKITFPDTLKSGEDYILDLFGDSGNISPKFTIIGS